MPLNRLFDSGQQITPPPDVQRTTLGLDVLGRFTEDLQALSRAIRWSEGDKLFDLFSRTREIRRGIIAAGQESAEPNFGRDQRQSSSDTNAQ